MVTTRFIALFASGCQKLRIAFALAILRHRKGQLKKQADTITKLTVAITAVLNHTLPKQQIYLPVCLAGG